MSLPHYLRRNRPILLRLVLPLAIVSIVSLAFVWPIDTEAALVNVATDALSIIVTVLYVDWVLRQHERIQWEEADKYASAEVGQFAHGFMSSVAEILGIEDQILPSPPDPKSAREIQASIIRGARDFPRERFMQPLRNLTRPQWDHIIGEVEKRRVEAGNVLNLFGFRMSPDQVALILKFRDIASGLLASYSLLRQFVGIPLAQLVLDADSKRRDYSEIQFMRTAIDLRLLYDLCLRTIDAFHVKPAEPEIDYNSAMKEMWDPPWAI